MIQMNTPTSVLTVPEDDIDSYGENDAEKGGLLYIYIGFTVNGYSSVSKVPLNP